MSASNNKLAIIQRAASAAGYGVIATLDDNAQIARLVNVHYDALLESMLTQHSWNFARRTEPLTKYLDLDPAMPWGFLWAKPPEALSLHYMLDSYGNRLEYQERDSDAGPAIATIYEDTDGVYAVFTKRVAENRLPADLAKALQYRIEAVFLDAVEQRTAARAREKDAEFLETKARVRDKRASTAPNTNWDLAMSRGRGRWNVRRG